MKSYFLMCKKLWSLNVEFFMLDGVCLFVCKILTILTLEILNRSQGMNSFIRAPTYKIT